MMTMVLLLTALCFAQEPQTFDPLPVDHDESGTLLKGILVDEATYAELLTLRTMAKTQAVEIESFEDWQAREEAIFEYTVTTLKSTCHDGMVSMRTHYDGELDRTSKRNFGEKHGFPLGIAIGVTVTTVLAVGTIAAVSEVYEVSVIR
jgi:hypothetical protein